MKKIKRPNLNQIICFDLEMCCWEDKPSGEIIEIGICQINLNTMKIEKEAQYFVKPEKDEISEFCTNLTGYTQSFINKNGRPLEEVLNTIKKNFGFNKTYFSWGRDDIVLMNECESKKIDFEIYEIVNFSFIYNFLFNNSNERKSQIEAMNKFKVIEEGKRHQGIDDAKNLAKLIIEIRKNTMLINY